MLKNRPMLVKCSVVLIVLFMFLLSVSVNVQAASGQWQLKEIGTIKTNPLLVHNIWEVNRPPYGTLDKITLHRVISQNSRPILSKKVILMLPGTWQAGGWSKITDGNVNPMIYLANNGYDVYTIDYRAANIPDMDYDQFATKNIDISSTTNWTFGVYREDVKACVEQIKKLSGVTRIFMSGFSKGATLMYIYANKYESDLKGLISFDGEIKRYFPPTGTPPMDEATYNFTIDLFKKGQLPITSVGVAPWLQNITTSNYENWKLAGVLPFARKMVGATLPEQFTTISDWVADDAHNLWGPGFFANYKGGSIDRDVLVTVIDEFTRYYPAIQSFEHLQLAAYNYDVPYFDYFQNQINLPALGFLTQLTYPPNIDAVPNLTNSSDVTVKFLPGYGHMDVIFGKNSLKDVKKPLLEWLNSHTR